MSAKSLALSHQGPWRCSVWLLVRSYTSVQWSKLDQCTAVYSSSLSSLAHHQKWVFRQCFILQWNRHIHHKKITKNIQIGHPQKKKRCLGLCPKPFDPSSSPRHSPGILAFLLVNIAVKPSGMLTQRQSRGGLAPSQHCSGVGQVHLAHRRFT